MVKEPIFLTIIVPVYNVEKYVAQCLDSIVNQTVMAHKCVIMDDGSEDNSSEIAQKYQEQYPEIFTYVRQENAGLGAARNRALKYVDTPFVGYLDSDDWIMPNFVEKVREALEEREVEPDIIFTLPWVYDTASKRVWDWNDAEMLDRVFFPNGVGDDNAVSIEVRKDLWAYALEPSTNRRIYRKAFLDSINYVFSENVKWEDVNPHFQTIHAADRMIAIKNTGFVYRINTENQITSGGGATRLDIIPVYKELLDTAMKEKWDEEEIAFIIRMMWSFVTWSIDVTNAEYVGPLLKGLHHLYRSIPYKYFKVYFNTCSPRKRSEMAKTIILRSCFYMFLKDYRVRGYGLRVGRKIKRMIKK